MQGMEINQLFAENQDLKSQLNTFVVALGALVLKQNNGLVAIPGRQVKRGYSVKVTQNDAGDVMIRSIPQDAVNANERKKLPFSAERFDSADAVDAGVCPNSDEYHHLFGQASEDSQSVQTPLGGATDQEETSNDSPLHS